jgi:hypothetical protein
MRLTSRVRSGRVRHLLLGLIAGIALASLVAAVIAMQLIGHERQRALAAMTEAEQQRELAEVANKNLTDQADRELQLKKQLADAAARAELANIRLDSAKADAEIAKLRNESAKMQQELNERNERIRLEEQRLNAAKLIVEVKEKLARTRDPLNQLPQTVTAGVVSVVGNRVGIDLGLDNRLRVGHILHVMRAKPELQYLGTLQLTNVEQSRAFGFFTPEKQGDAIQPGDEARIELSQGSQPRIPAVEQIGKVTAVEDHLAVISLGSEHGLEAGHILQVYRTMPNVQYLGTLTINRVETHRAVGIFEPAGKDSTIKVGDTVDTKIIR